MKWNLGLAPLPNVQRLLEDKGIKVFELATEVRQLNGLKADTEAGPVVVLASWLNSNLPRKRMTEVHELAHIVPPFADGIRDRDEGAPVGRFAGAFLLPEETFKPVFGPHRNHLGVGERIQMKVTFESVHQCDDEAYGAVGTDQPIDLQALPHLLERARMEVEGRTWG